LGTERCGEIGQIDVATDVYVEVSHVKDCGVESVSKFLVEVSHVKDCGVESVSRSLVNFSVLNDNLMKWLISFVKYISRF
jgi:predicted CopG family antitoxin